MVQEDQVVRQVFFPKAQGEFTGSRTKRKKPVGEKGECTSKRKGARTATTS